jgi:hypothetical protein
LKGDTNVVRFSPIVPQVCLFSLTHKLVSVKSATFEFGLLPTKGLSEKMYTFEYVYLISWLDVNALKEVSHEN